MIPATKLSFLGTGGALSEGRLFTSILVNDHILLDVSPSATISLKKMHKDLSSLSHILITHYHGDHTLGLPFLLACYAFKNKRRSPVHIIGPEDAADYTAKITEIAFPGVSKDIMALSGAQFFSFQKEDTYTVGGLTFSAHRMKHFESIAYGYRIHIDGKVVAYSGDTGPCKNLKTLIKDAHIIVLEMNFLEREFPHHLNLQNIRELKRLTLPHQKMLVTHIEEEHLPPLGDIIATEDMKEYEFPIQQ